MKKVSRLIVTLLLSLSLVAEAKTTSSSRSSSPSSSRPSFSSSSRPTPPKAPTPPAAPKPSSGFTSSSSPKPPTPPKPASGFTSSSTPKAATTQPTTSSSTISKFNNSAAIAPTKSKEQFAAEFRKQNERKYQTKFTTPPATRPSYIPATVSQPTGNYPVTFNPALGTYGYYGGFGDTFVPYDPFPALITTAYLANSVQPRQQVVHHTSQGTGAGYFWFGLFILLLLVAVTGYVYHQRS